METKSAMEGKNDANSLKKGATNHLKPVIGARSGNGFDPSPALLSTKTNVKITSRCVVASRINTDTHA